VEPRMYQLSIQNSFSAAHILREYKGNCARLHGHNWKVKVDVSSEELNEVGMAIDFKDLTDISWQVIGKFDHQNINEIEPFNRINPSAENLARYFYIEIAKLLPDKINIQKISIWEVDKYLVEYFE